MFSYRSSLSFLYINRTFVMSLGTSFTVEWEKVYLQEKRTDGSFTFQVTLHQNGDIVFVYSVIPFIVEQIEDTTHPVKVGLSDAYIMDRTVFCKYHFRSFLLFSSRKQKLSFFPRLL